MVANHLSLNKTQNDLIQERNLFCENFLKLCDPDNFGLDLLDAVLQGHQVLVHLLVLLLEQLQPGKAKDHYHVLSKWELMLGFALGLFA